MRGESSYDLWGGTPDVGVYLLAAALLALFLVFLWVRAIARGFLQYFKYGKPTPLTTLKTAAETAFLAIFCFLLPFSIVMYLTFLLVQIF